MGWGSPFWRGLCGRTAMWRRGASVLGEGSPVLLRQSRAFDRGDPPKPGLARGVVRQPGRLVHRTFNGEDVWCRSSQLACPRCQNPRPFCEPHWISERCPTPNSELAAQRAANGEPRLQLFLDGTAFLYSVLSDPALGPCWEWAIGTTPSSP